MSECVTHGTASVRAARIPHVPISVIPTLYGECHLALALVQRDDRFGEIDPRWVLSEAEYRKYVNFLVDKRQREFLLGRVGAKAAISALSGVQNYRQVNITNGIFCQPMVCGGSDVQVSIAHSGPFGFAAACHQTVPVGVDLECIDEGKRRAMQSYLSSNEIAIARKFSAGALAGLHIIWAAKEGLSKVLRCGLCVDSSVLDVKSVEVLEENCVLISFQRMPGYLCIATFVNEALVASLVFPNKLFDETLMSKAASAIASLATQTTAIDIGG